MGGHKNIAVIELCNEPFTNALEASISRRIWSHHLLPHSWRLWNLLMSTIKGRTRRVFLKNQAANIFLEINTLRRFHKCKKYIFVRSRVKKIFCLYSAYLVHFSWLLCNTPGKMDEVLFTRPLDFALTFSLLFLNCEYRFMTMLMLDNFISYVSQLPQLNCQYIVTIFVFARRTHVQWDFWTGFQTLWVGIGFDF